MRRHFGGSFGEFPQAGHVRSGQQLAGFGPALHPARSAHANQAAAPRQNLQPLAVFHGSHCGGLQRDIGVDLERGRPHEGLPDGGRVGAGPERHAANTSSAATRLTVLIDRQRTYS